ncbi:Uncharacterised protein (plasmid) [Mycoplasmopsis columboralis]|uniref:Uncharacterized protein n=1 Tax=Mycoplasmopsis columboralis TaxID=171282 RepID=A0A449B7M5_9BACT|nr:hypothetical protein [Mycoplasmopsis columboralis]VEU76601.1 Uncharacterised protein [Mycoplasmopsis columboralis]
MKVKQYSKYEDVPKQYRFDLEDILQGQTIETLIEQYQNLFEQRITIKDSKYNSLKEYLVDVKLSEEQTALSYRIENYVSNNLFY